jgi:hypothetical protein
MSPENIRVMVLAEKCMKDPRYPTTELLVEAYYYALV